MFCWKFYACGLVWPKATRNLSHVARGGQVGFADPTVGAQPMDPVIPDVDIRSVTQLSSASCCGLFSLTVTRRNESATFSGSCR